MRHKHWGTLALIALWALALSVRPAYAAPGRGDEVVWGNGVRLGSGELLDGDLVVLGGRLTMTPGSHITGDVVVLGGPVVIAGRVGGDVVVLGGDVNLAPQARVGGDVVTLGGRVYRAARAEAASVRALSWRGPHLWFYGMSWIWSTVASVGLSAMLAAVAIVVAAFWPAQTRRIGQVITQAPLSSLGVGCLFYPLVASLLFFMLITFCLAVFTPVVALAWVAAMLLGWIALGYLGGQQLARWFGWGDMSPPALAGLGVFTLTLAISLAGSLPGVGPLLTLVASSIGVGAVVLTYLGMRP